jgi:hypothetical protein
MGKIVKLKSGIAKTHKYKLIELINSVPHSISKAEIVDQIIELGTANELPISKSEIYADRSIPYGSKKSIPNDRMMLYEIFFSCTREDILNHTVKGKSIYDTFKAKRKTKHGLAK